MSEFEVGDRVRDVIWGGWHVGTVVAVSPSGWPDVQWDAPCCTHGADEGTEWMMPSHVVRIDQRREAA